MVIWHLAFDDLQSVVPYFGLRHFETAFESGGVFGVDHEEVSVRVVREDLEEGTKVVQSGEECQPGVGCDWRGGKRGRGETQLVDLGRWVVVDYRVGGR